MLISNFRGSPTILAIVYCESRYVSRALDECDHINACMQKKETAKLKIFIPKILEDNFENFILKDNLKMNEASISFDDSRSVTLNEKIKQSLNPLSLSMSNLSVSQSGLIRSIRPRSESLASTDNCPHNAPLTSLTPASPGAWDRESGQHERYTPHTNFPTHSFFNNLGDVFIFLILPDINELNIVIDGGEVTQFTQLMFVICLAILAVISALIGDSNSPMPPPVGGILDTPIVTFLSRTPVDLSLWIDFNVYLCTLASSIAIRARSAGGLLHQHAPPTRPDSNLLNHDKLTREVIDIVFVNQLIASLTPQMLISCSDLFIYLLIQVLSWTCLTKYHLIPINQDSSEKTT